MADTTQLFAAAVAHHQGGRWQEADGAYLQVLAAEPAHAGAWHLRGVLAAQLGQAEVAIRSISRAIELQPNYADAYNNLGLVFEKLGRWSEAAAHYQQAIVLNPGHAAAQGNLGNAFGKLGQWPAAVDCYNRAMTLEPQSSAAHFNLAVALQTLGKLEEAIGLYRRAIELKSNYAEAYNNLGVLLMGQPGLEAADLLRQAIASKPDYAEAFNNLATILIRDGKLDEARARFARAVELKPDYAEAHATLGNVLKAQGQVESAIEAYRRAIELKPELVDAHCNLGGVFAERSEFADAASAYRAAIVQNPNHAMGHFGLGFVLLAQGQEMEAAASFRRAIALKPDYAAAYANLAAALRSQENWPEIADCCRKAIALQPDLYQAHVNLANALNSLGHYQEAADACAKALAIDSTSPEACTAQGNALRGLGRVDDAIDSYRRALELKPSSIAAHSSLLYSVYFSPKCDHAEIYAEHRRWNERHALPLAKFIQPHDNDSNPDRRLRIGYFSPDFRDHCQSFFTFPLLSNHDHERFEVFCYAKVSRPDHITEQLRPLADQWRDIMGLSVERTVEQIRGDKIDIFVDLTLHMDKGGPLLFARKPAPVQVTWLGYPGTTGLTAIDYRFTDPFLDPPGMFDKFYAEESIRLSHTFWCYDPLTSEPNVSRLPAVENEYITFGCLNNFCKVNEGVLQLWAKVLTAVERSRLILMAPEGSARTKTLDIFKREGISGDRITFAPFQPRSDYLGTYHKVDIGLETLPYNGHTTSLDSFWMGVPVPTLVGQTVVGRAGVCLLENLGLQELIAHTPDEYVDVVSLLAGDLPRLAEQRAGLRERMQRSPLMNGPQFARDMEAAYRQIWRRWCEGQTGVRG